MQLASSGLKDDDRQLCPYGARSLSVQPVGSVHGCRCRQRSPFTARMCGRLAYKYRVCNGHIDRQTTMPVVAAASVAPSTITLTLLLIFSRLSCPPQSTQMTDLPFLSFRPPEYVCPKCGHFNPSARSLKQGGPGPSSATSSPQSKTASPQSGRQGQAQLGVHHLDPASGPAGGEVTGAASPSQRNASAESQEGSGEEGEGEGEGSSMTMDVDSS